MSFSALTANERTQFVAWYNLNHTSQAAFLNDPEGVIAEFRQSQSTGGSTGRPMHTSERDKRRAAISDATTFRALKAARISPATIERVLPERDRAPGWQDFDGLPQVELARQCLISDGYNPREVGALAGEQAAAAAMGQQTGMTRSGAALNTTGTFSSIMLDAANKVLLAAYAEAPRTWSQVFRTGEPAMDFKDIHRVKMGVVENLPVWPDNTEPHRTTIGDERESYAVESHSVQVDFSYRAIVDDDRSAFSRFPAMLGDAASRTVNAMAWRQVTANPVLSDGQPLFLQDPTGNRNRGNVVTGAVAPTRSSVAGMRSLLRQMRGLNLPGGVEGGDILNIEPRYLVGPSALESDINVLCRSSASTDDDKNAGVVNEFNSLQPVIEPLLDDNSLTAFYLFAEPQRIDTVEVTFLQGHEVPQIRSWVEPATLTVCYTVLQTFAAKAIDYRGMVRHNGA